MGGKGGGGGYDQNAINQAAFQAGAGGEKWNAIQGQIPMYHDTALESWKAGQGQRGGGFHGGAKPYDFFGDAMKGFHAPSGGADLNAQFDANMQSQQDLIRQQEEERRRIEGQNRRDAMYGSYLDAAGSATDYVNTEVGKEISNAQLLGIDYDITDDMKSTRINNYFASIWGEGQQSQLEALMKEWGNPTGFEGFTVVRGDASGYGGGAGEEQQVEAGRGQSQKPSTILQDDEEDVLGGAASVLGV